MLRVFQESAKTVNAGDQILEVGEPTDLEVEVDVLSRDAVRIRPGNRVMLEQWGGGDPLAARVRLIEPSAVTKISALGIEEQRVNIIVDFVDPPESRPPLGDGYRVEAAIVEWESADVLTVPAGALFLMAKAGLFLLRQAIAPNSFELNGIKIDSQRDRIEKRLRDFVNSVCKPIIVLRSTVRRSWFRNFQDLLQHPSHMMPELSFATHLSIQFDN